MNKKNRLESCLFLSWHKWLVKLHLNSPGWFMTKFTNLPIDPTGQKQSLIFLIHLFLFLENELVVAIFLFESLLQFYNPVFYAIKRVLSLFILALSKQDLEVCRLMLSIPFLFVSFNAMFRNSNDFILFCIFHNWSRAKILTVGFPFNCFCFYLLDSKVSIKISLLALNMASLLMWQVSFLTKCIEYLGTLNIESDPWRLMWCRLSTTWAILLMSEHGMGADGRRFTWLSKKYSNCFMDQPMVVTHCHSFQICYQFCVYFKVVHNRFFPHYFVWRCAAEVKSDEFLTSYVVCRSKQLV